jgi:hypothetical protein
MVLALAGDGITAIVRETRGCAATEARKVCAERASADAKGHACPLTTTHGDLSPPLSPFLGLATDIGPAGSPSDAAKPPGGEKCGLGLRNPFVWVQ